MADRARGRIVTDTAEAMISTRVALDPLGDAQAQAEEGVKKNFAKVGSSRPSSLIYT